QLERGGQWVKGKSCDTFAPVGPYLVTTDEVADPQNLKLWLSVNGQKYQNSNTSDMIFSVRYLISYLSQYMTLLPGDIVTTGTPEGVGLGMNPQVYLKPGDVVELGIEGLGEQKQIARAWGKSLAYSAVNFHPILGGLVNLEFYCGYQVDTGSDMGK